MERNPINDLSREDFQALLDRHTMTQIGEMYGVSREWVRQLRIKHGLRRGDCTRRWRLTKAELEALAEDHTGTDIARILGVSSSVVYYHMHKHGLQRGERFTHHTNIWLTETQRQHISEVGMGNMSRGLRSIIDQHMLSHKSGGDECN